MRKDPNWWKHDRPAWRPAHCGRCAWSACRCGQKNIFLIPDNHLLWCIQPESEWPYKIGGICALQLQLDTEREQRIFAQVAKALRRAQEDDLSSATSISDPASKTSAEGNQEQEGVRFPWGCLPSEVKSMILDIIMCETVPINTAYQFLGISFENQPLYVVQQVMRLAPPTNPPRWQLGKPLEPVTVVSFCNYALVCREWRDVFYNRFYGVNQFYFNISTYPLECSIRCDDSDFFKSLVRILPDIDSQDQPLGPLTGHPARFVKDAFLIVAIPKTPKPGDLEDVRKLVKRVADLWEYNDMKLRTLRVRLVVADQVDGEINALKVDVLHANINLNTTRPQISSSDLEQESSASTASTGEVEEVLEPLMNIRGLQDLTISGAVSEEFAAKFKDAVTNPK